MCRQGLASAMGLPVHQRWTRFISRAAPAHPLPLDQSILSSRNAKDAPVSGACWGDVEGLMQDEK